jgi:hypothetical protein
MLDLFEMFYLDIYWRKITECTYLLQPWKRSYKLTLVSPATSSLNASIT